MTDPHDQKKRIRDAAHASRNAQPDKEKLSQAICAAFRTAAIPRPR